MYEFEDHILPPAASQKTLMELLATAATEHAAKIVEFLCKRIVDVNDSLGEKNFTPILFRGLGRVGYNNTFPVLVAAGADTRARNLLKQDLHEALVSLRVPSFDDDELEWIDRQLILLKTNPLQSLAKIAVRKAVHRALEIPDIAWTMCVKGVSQYRHIDHVRDSQRRVSDAILDSNLKVPRVMVRFLANTVRYVPGPSPVGEGILNLMNEPWGRYQDVSALYKRRRRAAAAARSLSDRRAVQRARAQALESIHGAAPDDPWELSSSDED